MHIGDVSASEALDGQQFDVVVAAQVMHHVEDVGRAVASLARRLKPGGKLIVIDQLRDYSKPAKPPTALVPHRGGPLTAVQGKTDARRLHRVGHQRRLRVNRETRAGPDRGEQAP